MSEPKPWVEGLRWEFDMYKDFYGYEPLQVGELLHWTKAMYRDYLKQYQKSPFTCYNPEDKVFHDWMEFNSIMREMEGKEI